MTIWSFYPLDIFSLGSAKICILLESEEVNIFDWNLTTPSAVKSAKLSLWLCQQTLEVTENTDANQSFIKNPSAKFASSLQLLI